MVIITSLLVRNVEKFELQRESSQRDLKIRLSYKISNYRDLNYGKHLGRNSMLNLTLILSNLGNFWNWLVFIKFSLQNYPNLLQLIPINNHPHVLRKPLNISHYYYRIDTFKDSFFANGINKWNNLDEARS